MLSAKLVLQCCVAASALVLVPTFAVAQQSYAPHDVALLTPQMDENAQQGANERAQIERRKTTLQFEINRLSNEIESNQRALTLLDRPALRAEMQRLIREQQQRRAELERELASLS